MMQSGEENLDATTRIAFVQCFGISMLGGGARILRALLKDAPVSWKSFATGISPPTPAFGTELHVPSRPFLGRLEHSRLQPLLERIAPIFEQYFQHRLEQELRAFGATTVHSIPHGTDFISAWRAARRLGLRFFVSIHDDLLDTLPRDLAGRRALNFFPSIWRKAEGRFVISKPLGDEYCSRYGEHSYEIITDGAEVFHPPRARVPGRFRIYFMGLFHLRYEPNLDCLCQAVEIIKRQHPSLAISIILRCGSLRKGFDFGEAQVSILPFGSELDVEKDLNEMDLLYMPLPFGIENEAFVRFSLSTKMVSYLCSGIPILFHGPKSSAAHDLLSEANAAFAFHSIDSSKLADFILKIIENPSISNTHVSNSLRLARSRFSLKDQRAKFWRKITEQ